jgi:acyl-CoA reductase-like NAD-dependent aldehyde dehydrogenase
MEPLIRQLFEPLIRRGYVDFECHTTNERAAALVHHPLVTAVHLTGGKATHDAIVWGADPKQQKRNKESNTPTLKAEMTSELGAVSPWIVVPAKYTTAQLKDQAGMLAFMMHTNASCNCNAPKMIVVSETWDQKYEFLKIIETSLAENILPVPYYPGATQRWQTFRDQYPQAKRIDSTTGLGVKERQLSKPLLSSSKEAEATLLPHLVIDLSIDLTTEQGRESAKQEYAVNNEPFCPVYMVARMQHTETLESFCETAAIFCNDYVFGSLSGTVTVKPELQSTDAYQHLIANLKYGSIGVNIWGGFCYASNEGGWGAFPGESLANVESGTGRINNVLGFAGFEKFVMTSPIVSLTHPKLETNLKKQTNILRAVNKFTIAPGVGPIVQLISAVIGIDLVTASLAVGGAALASVAAYLFSRSG